MFWQVRGATRTLLHPWCCTLCSPRVCGEQTSLRSEGRWTKPCNADFSVAACRHELALTPIGQAKHSRVRVEEVNATSRICQCDAAGPGAVPVRLPVVAPAWVVAQNEGRGDRDFATVRHDNDGRARIALTAIAQVEGPTRIHAGRLARSTWSS